MRDSYCQDCELEFNGSELYDTGDPFGIGPRYYICESCNDIRCDMATEDIYA